VRCVPILLVLAACHGPALPAAPASSASSPYRVQVGDELAVRLFFTPELNEDVTVRPDGRITTQLAEAVDAAGRTPEDIAATLRTAYGAELKDPRLTVGIKTYAPVHVYVAGEVAAPGELTSEGPPPTLVAAIARAGGARVTGDTDRVLIIRRGATGASHVFSTRYADALSGRDPAADVALQPFDIVVVPRTGIAEVYVWVNQHFQQFVPVSWGFSYNVTPVVSSTKR
jgi:protein involved in polysaccharide export with SLBB domain